MAGDIANGYIFQANSFSNLIGFFQLLYRRWRKVGELVSGEKAGKM